MRYIVFTAGGWNNGLGLMAAAVDGSGGAEYGRSGEMS